MSTSTCQIYFEVTDMEAAHIIGSLGDLSFEMLPWVAAFWPVMGSHSLHMHH